MVDVVEDGFLADFDGTFIGRAFAQEDAQQGGFAHAVAAEDAGALGGLQSYGEAAEEPSLGFTFADAGSDLDEVHGDVAQFGRWRNKQIHLALFGRRFEAFNLIECFETMPWFGTLRTDAGADPIEFLPQKSLAAPLGLFGNLLADGF